MTWRCAASPAVQAGGPARDTDCGALQSMRVVQRNLVYVVGLALELCAEETLRAPNYFGQFGRIVKARLARLGRAA